MTEDPVVPRPVQVAGVLVGLQGVVGVVAVVAVLAGGFTGLTLALATAAWFAGCAAVLLALGVNLVRGRRGARSPSVVAQILLLGVAWYAAGPSSQPAYGISAAVFCAVVLVLLFCPPAVRWVVGQDNSH